LLFSSKIWTLDIGKEDGIDIAPNSANTNRNCYAAFISPNIPGEYDMMTEGLK
jgi:hypothetical protein